MKKLKNILIIVTIIVVASCSKKDDAPVTTGYPEQNPLTGFLVASGYNQTTRNSINNTNIYEIGFSFIPLVKGKINAIKIKIPNIKSGLRVSIWDKTANSLIRAESVDIGSSDTEITKTISPLELLKDNE